MADQIHFAPDVAQLVWQQARTITDLQAQVMRLRADVVIRETALAWQRDDLEHLKTIAPGLPKRAALARQVNWLELRVQNLMRSLTAAVGSVATPAHAARATAVSTTSATLAVPAMPVAKVSPRVVLWLTPDNAVVPAGRRTLERMGARVMQSDGENEAELEAGLAAADLVICQTGCVSHGAYWRVQDHCARTGKQCVLVEQPDALQQVVGIPSEHV